LKSSSEEEPVPVATGLRLRGAHGRLTARLVEGGVDQLAGRPEVEIGRRAGPRRRYEVEEYSVYRDRVVVKLRGVDDAAQAAGLVGLDILLPCKGLVDLPQGSYYIFELVGSTVVTREGREVGTVRDVVRTGGTPLLLVERPGAAARGEEPLLLPAARSICVTIDVAAGRIVIDPPSGLLDLE
jgi:16S rRNA processing protein RimM